jgi:Zn-dependent peptidase ImmA (M78 family)/predicted secreted protein
MAATRLHRDFGSDFSRPVDVFGMVQYLGIWLMAQPLDGLYGFYLNNDEAAGIVVNSQHPESLQRFTVAHEIGHHVLGHHQSADQADNMHRFGGASLKEIQAQTFAASLLMPVPLVNRLLRQIRPSGPLSPSDVYLFSRQSGVSFTAAVWTLHGRKRLDTRTARMMARRGAAAAKAELRGGEWVNNARADVWVLGPEHRNLSLVCRVGDELHLRLPEDLGTGHGWRIDEPDAGGILFADLVPSAEPLRWTDDDLLEQADREPPEFTVTLAAPEDGIVIASDAHLSEGGGYLGDDSRDENASATDEIDELLQSHEETPTDEGAADEPRLAGGGTRAMVVVPEKRGNYLVRLTLRPLWDADAEPVDEFELDVHAGPRSRIDGPGVVQPARSVWAAERQVGA